jgi:hypothetical protein
MLRKGFCCFLYFHQRKVAVGYHSKKTCVEHEEEKVFSDNSDLVIIVIIEMMNPLVLKTSTETKASGAPITDLAISEWILRWVCTNQSFEHQ